jgi:hypothetical protein
LKKKINRNCRSKGQWSETYKGSTHSCHHAATIIWQFWDLNSVSCVARQALYHLNYASTLKSKILIDGFNSRIDYIKKKLARKEIRRK